jgi:hypothetical protein
MAQVEEHLPSKCEVLCSNPSTVPFKKNNNMKTTLTLQLIIKDRIAK